jgi:hypothetical protein
VRISFGELPDFNQCSVKEITIGLYKVGTKDDSDNWTMITNRLSTPDTVGYDADAEIQKASQYINSASLECVTSTVDQSTGVAVFDSNLDPGFYFGTLISGPEDFSMSSFFVTALTSIEFSMEPKWSLVTSATVTKKWEDDSDRDGKRKSVEVKLFKKIKGNDASEAPYIDKSGKEDKEVTANIDSDTTFTVNNLPKYVDPRTRSTLYEYEWKETTTIDGYTVEPKLTGPDEKNYANAWVTSLVNKHTPERINLEIHKRWVDKSGTEIDPPSMDVSVDLYQRIGKSGPWQKYNDKPYVLNASNNWRALVNDLYAYQDGKIVYYRWVEKALTDYTLVSSPESLIVTVDNLDDAVQINGKSYIATELENRHDDEKTRHTVVKFWSDESDQDGLRDSDSLRRDEDKVESITIKLLKNGEEVKGKAVTIEESNLKKDEWSHTWDDLDRYTNGKENVYTCEEVIVPKGYTMSVSPSGSDAEVPHYETMITNTHIPETVDLTIEKVWKGDEKYPGYRKPITVIIHNNVVGDKDTPVTLSAENADPKNPNRWVVLKNVPKYSKGQEIEYSVAELKVDGYTTSVTKSRNKYQFTITNTLDVVSFSVTKEWDDGDNADKLRNKVEIQLLADGKVVSTITLPKNGDVSDASEKNWIHRWEEMPRKNEKGDTIAYEVKELTSLTGYSKPVISGNTTTGFRIRNPHTPYTGSLRIQKNVTVNGESTTGTAADGTYSFQVTGPNNYSQTVEIAVTNGKSGVTTINDLTPGTYTVTEEVPSDMTLVEENGRSVEVTGNNTSDIPTVAFTNDLTVEPSLGSLRIRKSVTVNSNATRGTRADGTYTFRVTGPNNYDQTVEITITNGASRTVRLNNLTPGTYTVTETVPSGMTLVGGNDKTADVTANNTSDIPVVSFTNNRTVTTPTPTPPTTPTPVVTTPPSRITTTTPTPTRTTVTPTPSTPRTITGSKVWVDDNNSHGTRPSSITLHLYANGSEVAATPTWSSTDGDVWSYTYTGLPSVDSAGRTITYTVGEESVAGYNGTVNGFTITNRLVPQPPQNYISVSGQKSWADDANAEGLRPGYITVRLYRNGTEIDSRNVTAGTGWSYTFASLPADDGYGNVYTYTVREDGVPGYYARQDGFNLTNYRLPPTTTPPPTVPRTSSTPPPAFETLTEENLEDLLDIFDYDTPLWGGLLGTGDTIPVYPFVFGGIGIAALLVLIIFGRRRKDEGAAA